MDIPNGCAVKAHACVEVYYSKGAYHSRISVLQQIFALTSCTPTTEHFTNSFAGMIVFVNGLNLSAVVQEKKNNNTLKDAAGRPILLFV